MAYNLVIVESPGKVKTIQKYLGENYIVKASIGHIRDLQENKLSIDVNKDFTPEYVVPADKKKVVAELKKAASEAGRVLLASDEDREGEAIAWHLFQTLGLSSGKTSRIVFHEITKDAILKALETPRDIDMNLVNAQQARRVLDRLVGFEVSPILWRKIKRGLSAGRVQSVALRLVVDREKEIMAFENKPYYKIEAVFTPEGSSVKLKASLDTRFDTISEARSFLEDSIGANFKVASVESKDGTRFPAPPFTTSTLQQEAGRKLRFSVSQTMRLAQSLYERGLITYMRTDSTNLSSLAINSSKKFIEENFGEAYCHNRQYKTSSKGAQEAHEAIRPTFIGNTAIEGTVQEQKLYELIWKRTVASQMSEAKLTNTTVKISSDKRSELFSMQAAKIKFDGFLKLYMEGTDDEVEEDGIVNLPELQPGTTMKNKELGAFCKFTQAPPRYSETSLVKRLEELGIGRPSTYAPTISTLTTGRGYIVKGDKEGRTEKVSDLALKGGEIIESSHDEKVGAEKNKLLPQEIGMIVTDFLVDNFADIMGYDFTANVEKDFDKIADGKLIWNNVIGKFYGTFHKLVDTSLKESKVNRLTRELGVDPSDGKPVVAKYGQYGAYVQKGAPEEKMFASLGKDLLIENITLEEALKLFLLPRTVGSYEGVDIIATKGRFGPYLKYGTKNISLPKGSDPLKITLEKCIELLNAEAGKPAAGEPVLKFESSDIEVINGRYGPYIKYAGSNYKIPKGSDAATLTEQACIDIINNSKPTERGRRRFSKK